jgi:SAM-dependent methyltransferase
VVGGTSYKDTTMLARIAAAGAATWEVDAADLDLPARRVEIDAVQDRLDGRRAQAIAGRRASADLLLVRHVLEHAHDLPGFLRAMTSLVKPGGWLVFEVPDASAMLALRDYSPLWEEHVTYFTPATLPGALAHHGLQPVETVTYPYPFENAVVVVARRGPAPDVDAAPGATPSGAAPAALAYFRGFETARRRQWEALAAERAAGRRIALLGAGHLACTWLNLLGAGSALDCVIDDDPRRAGLRMPGSGLPIVGSAALQERGIDLCLLGVNPLVEDRVVERHQPFVARGGIFRSIFPVSPRALTREVP